MWFELKPTRRDVQGQQRNVSTQDDSQRRCREWVIASFQSTLTIDSNPSSQETSATVFNSRPNPSPTNLNQNPSVDTTSAGAARPLALRPKCGQTAYVASPSQGFPSALPASNGAEFALSPSSTTHFKTSSAK